MKATSYRPVRAVLDDYVRQTLRYKWLSLPSLLLPGIGSTFVFYIPPLVIAMLMRDFGGQIPGSLAEITPYLLALAGAWFFGEACWHVAFLLMSRYQSRVIDNLYIYALNQLVQKDASFFNDNFTGSLTKRVTTYAGNYERFLDILSFNIAGNILPLIFAVVILGLISPILVIALLGIMALALAIVIPLIKRRMKLVRKREAANTKVSGHIADVISNISAVQAFAHEDYEQKLHVKYTHAFTTAMYNAWNYDTTRLHRTISPLNVLTNVAGLLIAIAVSKNGATMATVFVTFNYFINATRVMFEFNSTYRGLESAMSGAAEFTELLRESPRIVDVPGATDLVITKGEIEFKNVRFAYPETKDKPLFDHMNFVVPSGQKLALVGHSGGGKTSITRLLLRFSELDGGEILMDGQNIAEGTLASLRSQIAYVPQDPAMFHRSIADNIRYGKLDATDEEVREAARKAHATEFIEQLPNGFETLVGERGVKLSGGQRQRIAIARAIVKDAPILILDEATSALDSESEKLIQDALTKLMKGRTSIVVAHRLSTIAKLDRIIVLDKGTIAEDGSHAELLQKNGIYAKLWAHQSGGFIEE